MTSLFNFDNIHFWGRPKKDLVFGNLSFEMSKLVLNLQKLYRIVVATWKMFNFHSILPFYSNLWKEYWKFLVDIKKLITKNTEWELNFLDQLKKPTKMWGIPEKIESSLKIEWICSSEMITRTHVKSLIFE